MNWRLLWLVFLIGGFMLLTHSNNYIQLYPGYQCASGFVSQWICVSQAGIIVGIIMMFVGFVGLVMTIRRL